MENKGVQIVNVIITRFGTLTIYSNGTFTLAARVNVIRFAQQLEAAATLLKRSDLYKNEMSEKNN